MLHAAVMWNPDYPLHARAVEERSRRRIAPDGIVATAGAIVDALQRVSRTVPIVFVTTIDPVGSGFVDGLARPGGNATGFMNFEYSLSGKLLELLKQIAPGVTRVAVLRDPT